MQSAVVLGTFGCEGVKTAAPSTITSRQKNNFLAGYSHAKPSNGMQFKLVLTPSPNNSKRFCNQEHVLTPPGHGATSFFPQSLLIKMVPDRRFHYTKRKKYPLNPQNLL